jgi:uncharacterized protein YjdB
MKTYLRASIAATVMALVVSCGGRDNGVSVSLSHAAISLTVGATESLTAAIAPPDAAGEGVTWASSDKGVAAVSSGGLGATVTAVSAGVAEITVRTQGGKAAACRVSVAEPDIVVCGGFALNFSEATLAVGGSMALAVALFPSNATSQGIVWTSSSPAVADVAGAGLGATVTAAAPGAAVITARTADGLGASCVVTVVSAEEPYVICGGIVLLPLNATTLAVGESKAFVAAILPSNATDQRVAWASSNPAVADVAADGLDATVTAAAPGTAVITVHTAADGGLWAACAVTVVPAEEP